METLITIITGVCVFFFSQLILEFFIKPVQEYRELKRKISVMLTHNACYYTSLHSYEKCSESERNKRKDISEDTRLLASELRGFIETLPRIYIGIPKRKNLYDASAGLIGLSNGMFEDFQETFHGYAEYNIEYINKVKKLLNLYD